MRLVPQAVVRMLEARPLARKILAGIAVFFVLFTLTGFFVLPPLARAFLEKRLSLVLHREVSIRHVAFNPYTLTATVRGVAVRERGSQAAFISFGTVFLDVETASLFRRGIVVREVRLAYPYVNIVRRNDGRYNFSDLIEEFSAPEKEKSSPLRFSIGNIAIDNGAVNFWDGPKGAGHQVRELAFRFPFLSNFPYYVETFVSPSFSARVNGNPVSLAGKTKPFSGSLESVVDLDVTGVSLPRYVEYLPFTPSFRLRSAFLDLKLSLSYVQRKDNPPAIGLAGDAALREFDLADSAGRPMIAFPRLDVGIASSDLASRRIGLSKATLTSPVIAVRRDVSGRLNLMDLAPETGRGSASAPSGPRPKAEGERGISIGADALEIRGGKVSFSDRAEGRTFDTVLDGLTLSVRNFSNAQDNASLVDLSFGTEKGEAFALDGKLVVRPLSFEGTVDVKRAAPGKYTPYYAESVPFDVAAGTIDAGGRVRLSFPEEGARVGADGFRIDLKGLKLRGRQEGEEILHIPSLAVRDAAVDTVKREIDAGSVSTAGGSVLLRRRRDGSLNVAPPVPAAPGAGGVSAAGEGPRPVEVAPWVATLRHLSVSDYSVDVEDAVPAAPVSIAADRLRIEAGNISTRPGSRGTASLSLRLNGTGTFSAKGAVAVEPPSADLSVAAEGIGIGPFQNYFNDRIRILVTGGAASARGTLAFSKAKENESRTRFRGDLRVAGFSSLDGEKSEEFFSFESLGVRGIDFSSDPFRLAVAEVALDGFSSRLVVEADGSLNARKIAAGDATEAAEPPPGRGAPAPPGRPAADSPVPAVRIDNVILGGGAVRFTDRYVRPGYDARLHDIRGRVSGLSSEEAARADVEIRAMLENSAPLSVTGKVNPLGKELYLDLKVDVRDVDLSPMTPYSGRYAGYGIRKGKLSLDLGYLVERRKLDSRNVVRLDQFSFGEAVESKEATSLPVRLAVALLKDRQGNIRLDLPVTGSLDDPKFSVFRVVVKIVVNLLAKAATSPFALLGAAFGGGEEMSYAEFEPGSAVPGAPAVGKVSALEKILYERPGLTLEIVGRVDPENDREALRRALFDRKVKAQKLKELARRGGAAVSPDNVVVGPGEYPRYLERAYKEEKIPKPRNILGMAKSLPPPEMEKLLFASIRVTDDDLKQLARARAGAAKDLLLRSKRVEAERVFLVEPGAPSSGKHEKAGDSRVDFVIR